jgi:cell division protein FtsQ
MTEDYAREHILDLGDPIIGTKMKDLNVSRMEREIEASPYVKEVMVYKTVDQKLEVVITQRKPILRLIDEKGQSAYLDEEGKIMETSADYSERCIPLTGKFQISEIQSRLSKDSMYEGLLDMAQYINTHPFWKAQIVQMEMNKKGDLILIPRVGVHQVILGKPLDFQAKLDNLEEFYDKGITQTNWNLYQSLDLRFKDQVVCLKR